MRRMWLIRLSTGARFALSSIGLLLLAGLLITLIAVGLLKDVSNWSNWLRDNAIGLLIWRLCLYAALIYGWWRLHTRPLQHVPQAANRLRRAGLASVTALVLLELGNAVAGQEVS